MKTKKEFWKDILNIPLNWLNPPILFTKQKDLHHPNLFSEESRYFLFLPVWTSLLHPHISSILLSNQSLTYKPDRKTFLRDFSIKFCWIIWILVLVYVVGSNFFSWNHSIDIIFNFQSCCMWYVFLLALTLH